MTTQLRNSAPRHGARADEQEVPPGYKRTDVGVIPDDWALASCDALCLKIQDGTHFSPTPSGADRLYVTSRNIGRGILDLSDPEYISEAEHRKIYSRCDTRRGDLLLTKDGANTGNATINTLDEEVSLLSSVAFLRFDPRRCTTGFFLQWILSGQGQSRIKNLMSGNAITRLTLAKIKKLSVPVPPPPEQRAIAEALSDVDDLLGALDALIAKKRAIKQAAMQQLLTGKTRLPGFSGEWETRRIGDLLSYERPDKYIVKNADYSERGDIPVLTANKSFILGYTDETFGVCEDLPAIVFDDFTTDIKFVTIPFKVKSSAIKLLRSKDDQVSLKYTFERMGLIEFPIGDHKRYYISEYQAICIPFPEYEEQVAVACVLGDFDTEIAALEARRAKTQEIKQGMMQQLLTGRVRLLDSAGRRTPHPGAE